MSVISVSQNKVTNINQKSLVEAIIILLLIHLGMF